MSFLRAFCSLLAVSQLILAQLPPVAIPQDVMQRLVAAIGGDPFHALSDSAAADLAVAEPARERLAGLATAERIWLMRAGLRHDGATAVGAAALARADDLAPDERRAAARILMPLAVGPDLWFDWRQFRELFDAPLVDQLFAQRPPLPREVYDLAMQAHRSVVPRHILQLVQSIWADDVLLRRAAMDTLATAALHSNQYRAQIAAAVLGWQDDTETTAIDERQPVTVLRWDRPPETGGFPPLLVAVLRRAFGGDLDKRLHWIRVWSARWAIASTPSAADLPLLRELFADEDDLAVAIAAAHVRRFPAEDLPRLGEVAIARLAHRKWHRDGMVTARLLAHAAPERLRERGLRVGEGPELLMRLHVEPAATIAAWTTALQNERPGEVAALTSLAEAVLAGRLDGLAIAEPVWSQLRAALVAAELDEVQVAFALREVSALRCPALCARYLATLSATTLRADEPPPLDALELHDAAALRLRLRPFLGASDRQVRSRAAQALLRLGDPESGPQLLDQALADPKELDWSLLGRSASPRLRDALQQRMPEQLPEGGGSAFVPLLALAALQGLGANWCEQWAADLAALPPAEQQMWWTTLRRHLLADEAGVAVAVWLRRDPVVRLHGLGSCNAPAVGEILRLRREHGPTRRHAVEALALAGDRSAREEIHAAIAEAHYDWIDNMPRGVMLPADQPERIAALAELLESNCCMAAVVGTALGSLGADQDLMPETELQTRADQTRQWLGQFGRRLRWSQIAGRFAVVPE